MEAGKPKPPGISPTVAGIYHAAQAASATIMAQPSTIRTSQPLQPPLPNQFPSGNPNPSFMAPPRYIYSPYTYAQTYQPPVVMYPYPYQQQQLPSFLPRMIPNNMNPTMGCYPRANYSRPMTAKSTATNFKPSISGMLPNQVNSGSAPTKPNSTNAKSFPISSISNTNSDITSSTITTEDQDKFKQKLLTNNNRKSGWHLFLFEEDRLKIDNILKEAIEFEKHFANFEREFEKMSQTTTTIGDGSLLTYSSMWGSWKDNLLNRRQQMIQLQEKTLDNLYQKVRQMYPLAVTSDKSDSFAKSEPTVAATKPSAIPSPTEPPALNVFPAQVSTDQTNDPIAVNKPKNEPSSSLSRVSQTVHKHEQPDVVAKSKIDEPEANRIPKDDNKKTLITPKTSQQIQTAFRHQKQLREEVRTPYTDPSFLKTLNDLTFTRNEVAFLEDQMNLASVSLRKNRGRKEVVNSSSNKLQKPDAVVDKKVIAKQAQTKPSGPKLEASTSKKVYPKAPVPSEPKKPILALLGNPKKPLLTDTKKPLLLDPKKALLTDPKITLLPKPNASTNLIQIPCSGDPAKMKNSIKTSLNPNLLAQMAIQDRKNVMDPLKNTTFAATRPTLIPTQPANKTDRVSVLIPVPSTPLLLQPTTVRTTAKDQTRTNNIQIPLVFDSSSSSNKDKTINNKPKPRSLTEISREPLPSSLDHHHQSKIIPNSNPWPPIAKLQSHQLQQQQQPSLPKVSPPSMFVESTYYDGGDSNSSSLSDRLSKLPPSTVPPKDIKISCVDINLFIERERQLLHEKKPPPVRSSEPRSNLDHPMAVQQSSNRYTMPEFFTTPRKYTEEPLYIKDLLDFPARTYRPHKIALLIRGLPGSGKSRLAEWIHKKEKQNNALVKSRVLSLDHYYMVDVDDDEDHHHNYRKSKHQKPSTTTMMVYDASKEREYDSHLFKEFCRQCNSGYYNFLIVDTINSTINEVRNYYAYAIENNYIPYVIEMEAIVRKLLNDCVDSEEIVAYCYKHNHQGRSLAEIRSLYEQWELLPPDYLRVDAYQFFLKNQNSKPTIDDREEMGNVSDKESSKNRTIFDEQPNVSRFWHSDITVSSQAPIRPSSTVSASKWWQLGDDQEDYPQSKDRRDSPPTSSSISSRFNHYHQDYAEEEDHRSRYDSRTNRSPPHSEHSNSNNMKKIRLDQKDPMLQRAPPSSSSASWSPGSSSSPSPSAHCDNNGTNYYHSSYYGPPLNERGCPTNSRRRNKRRH